MHPELMRNMESLLVGFLWIAKQYNYTIQLAYRTQQK